MSMPPKANVQRLGQKVDIDFTLLKVFGKSAFRSATSHVCWVDGH